MDKEILKEFNDNCIYGKDLKIDATSSISSIVDCMKFLTNILNEQDKCKKKVEKRK